MDPDRKSSEHTKEANGLDQASISELMRRLSDQVSTLARKEVELAKVELTEKGKRLGVGAGAFGAAGVVALFALGALTTALILALETVVAAWLAALIVATVYGLVAGALALAAKQKVEAGSPPMPERAIESTKLDVETAKAGMKEGRNG